MSEQSNSADQVQQGADSAPDAQANEKNQESLKEQVAKSQALHTVVAIKEGMTRIFKEDGAEVPVTVLRLIPNYVTQVKTTEKEGYNAYQIGYGVKRDNLGKKPAKGHLKKAKIEENITRFQEVKLNEVNPDAIGAKVDLSEFSAESFIDVTGISKGKGFQGVMKKFGFSGGPASHGSKFHRRGGSIGNRATPGKVFKNKKMPGHHGDKKVTVQNLEIVEVNSDKGYMLIKGSIPGSKNSFVRVSKAIKK